MNTNIISRTIVIDDKEDEVSGLLAELKKRDIQCDFFTPATIKGRRFKKERQLLFLDLSLNDTQPDMTGNIATLRKILKDTIGCSDWVYGVVIWSKHTEHVKLFKEKLQEDNKPTDRTESKYSTPIFIVSLDKQKYLKDGFDNLFADLEQVLCDDAAALFFLEWLGDVDRVSRMAISQVYDMSPDYNTTGRNISFILRKLALNHTGIKDDASLGDYPLHIDAFKAFDEIMLGNLVNGHASASKSVVGIKDQSFSQTDLLPEVYARLNKTLFIDSNSISQNHVIPGNIYQLLDMDFKFKSNKMPEGAIPVAIEVTPPCDFADPKKRLRARMIGGFVTPAESTITGINGECFYKALKSVMLPNHDNPQRIVIDFRCFGDEDDCNLKDEEKYKLLFRATPKLFSDILQKFSSHASRLGLSTIE